MLDFDDNRTWGLLLTDAVGGSILESVPDRFIAAAPELVEDARDLLFEWIDRDSVIDATLEWIRSTTLLGYHGTRLIDAEVDSIQAHGILPLKADARQARLVRALSSHPRWSEVAHRLNSTLHRHGPGEEAGRREGQVHLTLSRRGLLNDFNHYMTHGSEFDQDVAVALLGDEGKELLRKDGDARVIRVAVPGPIALKAAHPYFSIDDLRKRGDVPNLVDDFLKAWSYGLAYPDFECGTLEVDCGMLFESTVPSTWIVDIETLSI